MRTGGTDGVLQRRDLLRGCLAGLAGFNASAVHSAEVARAVDDPNIDAMAMLLPGLVDHAGNGPFVDLLRAVDEFCTEGRLRIRVAPVARVYAEVSRGVADLGLPTLRLHRTGDVRPYRLSRASFGQVNFVLYSRRDRPLTRADLESSSEPTQLHIEAPDFDWGFPVQRVLSIASALHKLDLGRIDGLLWAQEEGDLELRRLGLRRIHRKSFGDYEDVMLMPHTPRGEFVDRVVSAAVDKLRASGRLQALYQRVHRPHQAWQP